MSRTGLVVAERLTLVRDGLMGLLAGWPHGPVRAAPTLDSAIHMLAQDHAAVLLLDLDLLGTAGPEALQPIRRRFPGLRIIALAPSESRDEILQCLAAGAHGYIAKTAGFAELARAIEAVRKGGVHVPAAMAGSPAPTRQNPPAPSLGALTGRQREILLLLAQGRSTKDIARTLDLAVSTIKVHLAAVYRTFGARNRVEALCRAGCLPQFPTPLPAPPLAMARSSDIVMMRQGRFAPA